ncbi:MAG: Asp23/Gls24 family envelope stress response protein [Eubacterium sp.]|nr:Asp23/Gls24 family envelope stress response protein [Eubacterium sp.]
MSEVIKDAEFVVNDENDTGIIQIADDVVSSIVGLACTEVDGVSKLTGGITRDIISKLGKNNLSNGIRVVYQENNDLKVDVSVEVKFGFNIVDVSKAIQEKVKQSLLTMTGLKCDTVNVRVSSIDFSEK